MLAIQSAISKYHCLYPKGAAIFQNAWPLFDSPSFASSFLYNMVAWEKADSTWGHNGQNQSFHFQEALSKYCFARSLN